MVNRMNWAPSIKHHIATKGLVLDGIMKLPLTASWIIGYVCVIMPLSFVASFTEGCIAAADCRRPLLGHHLPVGLYTHQLIVE